MVGEGDLSLGLEKKGVEKAWWMQHLRYSAATGCSCAASILVGYFACKSPTLCALFLLVLLLLRFLSSLPFPVNCSYPYQ